MVSRDTAGREGRPQGGRHGVGAVHPTLSFFIAAASMFVACAAQGAESGPAHAVVLDAAPLERGESFACRIPVSVRHAGSPQLKQVNVVAEILSGGAVVGKTGLASGRRPIIMNREEGGLDYEPVPLQFELTPDLCRRADGLRISFARCVFGEQPATDCIERMNFAQAGGGDPLFLPIGKKPAPGSD